MKENAPGHLFVNGCVSISLFIPDAKREITHLGKNVQQAKKQIESSQK